MTGQPAGSKHRLRSGLTVQVPRCNPTRQGIAKMEGWLLETMRAEAKARGDEYVPGLFASAKPGKLPPADVDMLNDFVFDGAEIVA